MSHSGASGSQFTRQPYRGRDDRRARHERDQDLEEVGPQQERHRGVEAGQLRRCRQS